MHFWISVFHLEQGKQKQNCWSYSHTRIVVDWEMCLKCSTFSCVENTSKNAKNYLNQITNNGKLHVHHLIMIYPMLKNQHPILNYKEKQNTGEWAIRRNPWEVLQKEPRRLVSLVYSYHKLLSFFLIEICT